MAIRHFVISGSYYYYTVFRIKTLLQIILYLRININYKNIKGLLRMRKRKITSDNSVRKENEYYTRGFENPSVLYNGGVKAYEDPADFYRKAPIKAVRLG